MGGVGAQGLSLCGLALYSYGPLASDDMWLLIILKLLLTATRKLPSAVHILHYEPTLRPQESGRETRPQVRCTP